VSIPNFPHTAFNAPYHTQHTQLLLALTHAHFQPAAWPGMRWRAGITLETSLNITRSQSSLGLCALRITRSQQSSTVLSKRWPAGEKQGREVREFKRQDSCVVPFRFLTTLAGLFSEGIREFYVIEYFRATGSTVLYVLVCCKERNAAALGTSHQSAYAHRSEPQLSYICSIC